MSELVLAYLTNQYARASDTFIRGEVRELREHGYTVKTFSIRRAHDQQFNEEIRNEQDNTTYLLECGFIALLTAAATEAATHPMRVLSAFRLAMKLRSPGVKSLIWHLAYLVEAAFLARRLRALGVQHLHNHLAGNSATVAVLAARMARISTSTTIHGPHEFFVIPEIALGQKIAESSFFACITSFCKSQCMIWSDPEHWGKLHEVHCGLDARFIDANPSGMPERPRLMSVSRLAPEKGQLLLVEAAARLKREGVDFELVLVGDGPMRDCLKQAIEEYRLEGCVELAGWKGSDEVAAMLGDCRALVMSSFAEGLPVVIMEAMAMGRPVISTCVAGIPELVKHGENGWLVPAGDVDALAEAMREALETPIDRLTEMGRAGRDAVRDRHDIRKEVAKLAELFEATIAEMDPSETAAADEKPSKVRADASEVELSS